MRISEEIHENEKRLQNQRFQYFMCFCIEIEMDCHFSHHENRVTSKVVKYDEG